MNTKHNPKTLISPHMAPITFFIILTLTLTLSSTIHARESQFFNKFSNKESLNTNQQQQQQQTLNTNQQQQQQQQQPEFIPQSKDSDSYGLYGHESGQLPPSATTTNNNNNLPDYLPENYNPVAYTTPIHSSTQDIPEEYREYPQAYNNNGESKMYNSEMQENGRYKSQKQGFGFDDARFMEREDGGGNMYNSEKRVDINGRYNSEKQGMMEETRYYGTRGNGNMMYNPEKQGMSDTRFLENGKYYYDLNMENPNYNPNMNTREFGSRNGYNTQGYYGNNQNRYNYNNNGGYQNQEYRFNP